MPKDINLKIEPPVGPIPPGRGFYQLDEEILFVQIGLFLNRRKFYSYLETDNLLLDIDSNGRLIFIELDLPRRKWNKLSSLKAPKVVESADIKWFDFRDKIPQPKILSNDNKNILKLEFTENPNPLFYRLAEKIIIEANQLKSLSSIWIVDILNDFAGHEIGAYRKTKRLHNSYFI